MCAYEHISLRGSTIEAGQAKEPQTAGQAVANETQTAARQLRGSAKTMYVVSVIDRTPNTLICRAW